MSRTSQVEMDCDGDGCGLVELVLGASFPCSLTLEQELASD